MTPEARTAIKRAYLDGLADFMRVITGASQLEGFRLGDQSGPYANRREAGHRMYLTVSFPEDGHARD